MHKRYIYPLTSRRIHAHIGTKGRRLQRLAQHGFAIPSSWACTWEAYERYIADDTELVVSLRSELRSYLNKEQIYAVRSSANLEDGFHSSFAGQFKSVLNVQGIDEVVSAIWSIWATTQAPQTQAYLDAHKIDGETLKMAVLIQEMVPASIAGVVFTHDPVTGEPVRIIEAVRGSGEQLMQKGITPERWVRVNGSWRDTPSDPILSEPLAIEIASEATRMMDLFEYPADSEWVFDGQTLYWVQLREITTLDGKNVYSNRIAREYLPGVTLPLVWSINVPTVNEAWIELLTEIIGTNTLTSDKLAKAIHYHAYFNMSALGSIFEQLGLPRDSLEQMRNPKSKPSKPSLHINLKILKLLPRIIRSVIDKLRFERKLEPFLKQAQTAYRSFRIERIPRLSVDALLDEIRTLRNLNQRTAYYNLVTPLLMQIYSGALKKRLARLGIAIEQLNLRQNVPAFLDLDPVPSLRRLKLRYDHLSPGVRARIKRDGINTIEAIAPKTPEIEAFRAAFHRFLVDFGHLSDSGNDFSSPRWRETPELILGMIINYEETIHRDNRRSTFEELDLPWLSRRRLRKLKDRALKFMVYRERIGSIYTYAQSLLRIYTLAVGRKMTEIGWLDKPEDIFYLYWDEIIEWLNHPAEDGGLSEIVDSRRAEVESSRDLDLPEVIYGDVAPPREVREHGAQYLFGTPTSSGRYRGPACIVHGIRDFEKVRPGNVLVVPFTDVSWTPLFLKAGAVVAESGGLLSHSSIIAREYGIPAVVSVAEACRIIPDGAYVSVDGYRGRVSLEVETPKDEETEYLEAKSEAPPRR